MPDERVALANEQLRELSAAVSPSYGGEDSLRAASDFASTAPPAADGRHVPQGGRNDLTEIIPVVEDDHEPYSNPFADPPSFVPVDESPSWTGTQAYSAGAYANETTVVVADEAVEVSEAEAAGTPSTPRSHMASRRTASRLYGEQTYGEHFTPRSLASTRLSSSTRPTRGSPRRRRTLRPRGPGNRRSPPRRGPARVGDFRG